MALVVSDIGPIKIATAVMTLSVVEGHSAIASFFKCDFSYLWQVARCLCIILQASLLTEYCVAFLLGVILLPVTL